MKVGYPVAVWRLLQPSLRLPVRRGQILTWAEAVLASAPYADTTPQMPIIATAPRMH